MKNAYARSDKYRKKLKKDTRTKREKQIRALYPHVRTFELKNVESIGAKSESIKIQSQLPRTITLVTPDLDNPSKDHLYIGTHPVLSKNMKYCSSFEELTFDTSDGEDNLKGHLRLTHSRTKAYGVIDFKGESFSVEYEVKPQRYKMKLAKGAAYLAGSNVTQIKWDVNSDRWKNADWGKEYEIGFTYGINGEEIIGEHKVYTFVAKFDSITNNRNWDPEAWDYSGLIDRNSILDFNVIAGVTPPTSGPNNEHLFPFKLKVKLSEFAYDFEGGMLCDKPSLEGTAYGLKGKWENANIAGMYHLQQKENDKFLILSVHDKKLCINQKGVANSHFTDNQLNWTNLSKSIQSETGLPKNGHITFSENGQYIVDSSLGLKGVRVHPDQVAEVSPYLQGLDQLSNSLQNSDNIKETEGYQLSDLLRMSQYVKSDSGNFYDTFQKESMEDFYAILQEYMNPDYRKKFFNPNPPPPLGPGLYGISRIKGENGEDPDTWYKSLSVAYTTATLAKWSDDKGAKLLNGKRASAWLEKQTAENPVMKAQSPLLYARRYKMKHKALDWFLKDQIVNAPKYAGYIDKKVEEWKKEIKENVTDDPEDPGKRQKIIDQVTKLGDFAKENKQYWAFAVYAYTSTPAYMNMLQTVMMNGVEIDGSEFTQRVQRTIALLNVLDTSSFISNEYAYMLQLWQITSILPQTIDYSENLEDFNFAVKQILDKFIETYINSPDPEMRKAAEEMKKNSTAKTISEILETLRTSSTAAKGLFAWAELAATFESKVARFFAHIPKIVSQLIVFAAVGYLINMFVAGEAKWNELPALDKASIIIAGSLIVAQFALGIIKRVVAFRSLFRAGRSAWSSFKLFFSPSMMARAQAGAVGGFRGWLIGTGALQDKILYAKRAAQLSNQFGWANAAADAQKVTKLETLQKIFGKNLNQFLSRFLGSALAVLGIVMSAYLLSKGGDPFEIAANVMFLLASTLELFAIVGLWAVQAFATTVSVGVTTLFAVIPVIGWIVMIIGAILIAIFMFRPRKTPVEEFAENDAGMFYMPYKTAIDYLESYQPKNEPQRAGVALSPNGVMTNSMYVAADGTLHQKQFDASGHTSFYLRVNEFGYAEIGAPLLDSENKSLFLALSIDDSGSLMARSPKDDDILDGKTQWIAEISSEGQYDDEDHLEAANFKFYNRYWFEKKGVKRYISTIGETKWGTSDGDGTSIKVEMVVTKPAGLTMSNIDWLTIEHDNRQAPGLVIAGSGPRTWALEGELPSGLYFEEETGTIMMETGIDVPEADKKSFKIKLANAVEKLEREFSIQISKPEPTLT